MKHNEIKGENRRALPRLLLRLCGYLLVGGAIGFFIGIAKNMEWMDWSGSVLEGKMRAAALWGIPVSTVVLLGVGTGLYRAARRICDGWDGEDEEVIAAAERKINWVMLTTILSVAAILFFFTAILIYGESAEAVLIGVGEMFLAGGMMAFLQQKAVDLVKRINPEKKGSVYDAKFHEKWLESCDEAEQAQIGQAAYKAYRVTSTAAIWLWVVLVMVSFVFDCGLLPMAVALLLWVILQMSYLMECIRMESRR